MIRQHPEGPDVEIYAILTEMIDLRSFSNLWFWIVLAVQWSMASHWPLGVPFDLIQRARRKGGSAQEDLEAMSRVSINRMLHITRISGAWMAGIIAFLVSGLAVLGFAYGVEFAQALFCLMFPMVLVGVLSLRAAHRIAAGERHGPALIHRLMMLRLSVQALGMLAILATTMWGMWVNLRIGPI